MRKSIYVFAIGITLVLFLSSCVLGPLPGGSVKGEVKFDFDLSYPASMGYMIDQVKVTLTHKASGKEVVKYLEVDPESDRASGTVRNLRVGTWGLVVELYEEGTVVGSGQSEVEIVAGQTTKVEIRMKLDTGNVEIIVIWDSGDMIFDFDLRQFIKNGYDLTQIRCILENQDTGSREEIDLSFEDYYAYGELKELAEGTWDLKVELFDEGGLMGEATTEVPIVAGEATKAELLPVFYDGQLELLDISLSPVIYGLPDFRAFNLTSRSIAEPGEVIGPYVSVEIKNEGMGPAYATDDTVTVAFYLSTDWAFGIDDIPLLNGRIEIETPIELGESRIVNAPPSMAIPSGTQTGYYLLYAIVDDEKEIGELYESNNFGVKTIEILVISLPAPKLKVGIEGAQDYTGYTFYFGVTGEGDDPYVDGEVLAVGSFVIDANGEGSDFARDVINGDEVTDTIMEVSSGDTYDVYGFIDVTGNFDRYDLETYEPDTFFDLEVVGKKRTVEIIGVPTNFVTFDYSADMQITDYPDPNTVLIGACRLPEDLTGGELLVKIFDVNFEHYGDGGPFDIEGDEVAYAINVYGLPTDIQYYIVAEAYETPTSEDPVIGGWYGYFGYVSPYPPYGGPNVDISKIRQWTFRFELSVLP